MTTQADAVDVETAHPAKVSRKTAIDAFCKQCIYDPSARGNWRQQVEACEATNCPLYAYRPLTIATTKLKAKSATRPLTGAALATKLKAQGCPQGAKSAPAAPWEGVS